MRTSDKDALAARAVDLVRGHLGHLNHGDLPQARLQLFWPDGMPDKPVDVYLQAMRGIAPFQIVSLDAHSFKETPRNQHGAEASIGIAATVTCSLGQRATDFTVWWFRESDRLLISSRPTEWVLEKLKTNGTS
jgi:hypothetical protein